MISLDTDIKNAKRPKRLPRVLTSFNWHGYEVYGKRFIETWKQCWSPNIQLTIYYEGEEFNNHVFESGVSWHPIEEVEFLRDYLDNLRFPIMHGIVGESYDINFDARQARKTFMEVYHARKYGGKVFWMDADAITHSSVPEGWLDEMLPDDKFCCYLGRDGWYFTESGFIGFNADHPMAREFFKNYIHLFITGVIFTQQWWHDCIGFDAIRTLCFKQGKEGEFVNLASKLPHGTMHPYINSDVGKYMDHQKGPRKGGTSGRDDLVVERTEPYWLKIASTEKT